MYNKIKKENIKKKLIFIIFLAFFKKFKWVNKIYQKKAAELGEICSLKFSIKKIKLARYNCLEIRNLEVKKGALLVRISKINIHLSLIHILKRKLKQSLKVEIDEIHLSKMEISKNTKSSKPDTSSTIAKTYNWEKIYYTIFKKCSNYLFRTHPDIAIESISVDINKHTVHLRKFSYVDNLIISWIDIASVVYKIEGTVCNSSKSITLTTAKPEPTYRCNDLAHNFDHFCFIYTESTDNHSGTTFINITAKFEELSIENTHIRHSTSSINNIELGIKIEFNEHSFNITEESGGSVNQIPFVFQFLHDAKENDLIRTVFCIEIEGDLFLKTFPQFYNEDIRTLSVQGKITLEFSLTFLINNPYNHLFDIKVLDNNISISDNGNFDLSYLNSHYNRKNDNYSNNFSRLNKIKNIKLPKISPLLLSIFIFTEDPNFYNHKGIDPFFIGYAVVSNIAKRKFARGASTITMQVVRNLFLFHDKTVVRKLEETIIALLIENHFKISKNRLLEIYLNIIEFGPDIYGIGNASEFYFSKKPIDLTLIECLVLSYIIPRPIHFYDALLIKTPQLLINLPKHIKHISGELLKRNLITESEYANIGREIKFGSQFGTISVS